MAVAKATIQPIPATSGDPTTAAVSDQAGEPRRLKISGGGSKAKPA
ncbi:MAG TPA: hypothetical protein VJQ08_06375 [Candidatus Dormibacteraeota bacterium]|nr:hypothetical protein [Candidatus Dormibacteraeota bacterium]